jgi:DNA polymerase-3 subunit epsilon
MLGAWRLARKCRKQLASCTQEAARGYLQALPSLTVDKLENTPIIAVDLELSGLDSRQDHIVAIGWVHIDAGRISIGSSRHLLVNDAPGVGASATIHELRDADLQQGLPLVKGLGHLLQAATGRLWVFHHATLDAQFIQRACRQWASCAPPILALDTLLMEKRSRDRHQQPLGAGALSLSTLRADYGLPAYEAHNAQADALGSAELLLAMAAHRGGAGSWALQPQLY